MKNKQFCTNCGAKVEKNNKFCISCGAKVNTLPQSQIIPNKKKKTSLIIIGCVVLLCVIAFGVTQLIKLINQNKTVEFVDFTVERCVREELDIDWDEEITVKDVEKVKKLCISSMYDPTFAISDRSLGSHEPIYYGYIDLSDLRKLKNLEELEIDTFGVYDSIVNLDAITECKKLEKLSIPWTNCSTSSAINPLGYKYWQTIVKELPKLEYLDLGQYFDEHMKTIVLAETDNDIEFYFGNKIDLNYDGERNYCYQEYDASIITNEVTLMSPWTMMYEDDYAELWNYEYKSVESKIKNMIQSGDYRGTFPTIYTDLESHLVDEYDPDDDEFAYADNMETLEGRLKKLDKKTEDIIVMYDGEDELDFSIFERFDNLVTLSVFGSCFNEAGYYDYETLTYITTGGYTGVKAVNLDSLSELDNLQVLNLGGFIGDISEVKDIKNLRELSIIDCAPETIDFISELDTVKELILTLYCDENKEEFYSDLNKEVTCLENLKLYRDYNRYEPETTVAYKNIDNMKSLETLIVLNNKGLKNIVESHSLKNLYVHGRDVSNISFEEMENLEQLIFSASVESCLSEIDYDSIVELPNIKMVVYPYSILQNNGFDYVLTSELAQKIVKNENITAFGSYVSGTDIWELCSDESAMEFINELYSAGIDDGLLQDFIRSGWRYGEEYTYEDFYETYGY